MVTKITNNDISAVLNEECAVVDFSAVWCGPCKMIAPIVDELSEELAGKVAFYNADADENMDLAQQYKISSIPALVYFKKGEVVGTSVGFMPKPQLTQQINNYLG